ncbi:sugar phosphate nucleotidyltransferase [Halomicrococcus sp. NG-SE-24]|uniref:sugar phosphate nucleotidyltransferase n=1 Tax=Halomicrococcus sp. NG-SE-24 TaxID=3436928 RepID=UPI003D96B2A6
MKAVVLAAGEGSRLQPLTNNRPKPMLPVGNRPLLEHIVEALASTDIDEVILVVGYQRQRIQSYFGNGRQWDIDIRYVVQERRLGTGHALLQAEQHIGDDFLALNGDRIIEPSIIEDVAAARQETKDTCLAVTSVATPNRYGVVRFDGQIITDIVEQPQNESASSSQINAGVYGLGPDIFAAIRRTDASPEQALTVTLSQEDGLQPIQPVSYDGLWGDISYPWDLAQLNGYLLDRETEPAPPIVDDNATVMERTTLAESVTLGPGVRVLPRTAVGENVEIGSNAVLENAVIFPDVTIGPGAVLRDCVVGAGAEIGPNTVIRGGKATTLIDDEIHRDVPFGGLIGDRAQLGGNVTVEPGTTIGELATVESGTTINKDLSDTMKAVRG